MCIYTIQIPSSLSIHTQVHSTEVSVELCPVTPLQTSTQPKVTQLDVTLQQGGGEGRGATRTLSPTLP